MKVLSLFDGISCGRIALERAGIEVEKYYASEIEKNAIEISKHHYPDIIQLGDVNNWKEWGIDWGSIDLLIGGFPCQTWSMAGQKAGDKDPRGQLLWTLLDIRDHILKVNPNLKWMFENVAMKKDFKDYISNMIGVEPVLINSALVSAQERKRLYWCNFDVEQPEDKNIFLEDVVEDDALVDRDKAHAIIASVGRTTHREYFKKNQGQMVFKAIMLSNIYGGFKEKKPRVHLDKSITIRANSGGGAIPSLIVEGKAHEFTLEDFKKCIRKVTPLECERLQTLPEGYTKVDGISDTQRYKAIGNGWTVDVIAHIFRSLKNEF